MRIKINRYMLSYEGKIYKAGDEVEIQDSNLAKKIVAQSKGNFEILHSDHSKIETSEISGLPEVDPAEMIDNGKKHIK